MRRLVAVVDATGARAAEAAGGKLRDNISGEGAADADNFEVNGALDATSVDLADAESPASPGLAGGDTGDIAVASPAGGVDTTLVVDEGV